jgi:hypothetical protein
MVAEKIASIGKATNTKSVTADPLSLEADHTIHGLLEYPLQGGSCEGPHHYHQACCHESNQYPAWNIASVVMERFSVHFSFFPFLDKTEIE